MNFDSYDVPIGAIIHEDGPHEEGHLDNSDIYTFSNRLGTSWVRDWGYFGFSIGRIENSYGIAFHGEEEEHEEDDGDGGDGHDDDMKVKGFKLILYPKTLQLRVPLQTFPV